ncbi:YheC/YheD family protein [Metabacillus sp. RGM 3146]|uniref:YheC/YheD family endospore coat-associated protein n=1 Tax=Metabacillus sp. RGM 3146 TaxID=3401092 RepID=UPI003B99C79F
MNTLRFPVIGILAGSKTENGELLFSGDGKYFKQLQQSIHKSGGLCYVMTPESFKASTGFLYFPSLKKWALADVPKPQAVYIRIPSRKEEKGEHFQGCLQKLKLQGVPCFNPFYFHKWEVWKALYNDSFLLPFLPPASLLESEQQLYHWLNIYRSVYLKPAEKSKGKGILRVSLTNGFYYTETIYEKKGPFSFQDLLKESEFSASAEKLIQAEIHSDKIDGRKYDLRVLSVWNGIDYELTGIGVRQSDKQDVTTHIPAGGKLFPSEAIMDRIDVGLLKSLVQKTGTVLSKHYGEIGEFSMDIGRSHDGQYWIYEVNSRPMAFDEKDIQTKRIHHLKKLFTHLANNAKLSVVQ